MAAILDFTRNEASPKEDSGGPQFDLLEIWNVNK